MAQAHLFSYESQCGGKQRFAAKADIKVALKRVEQRCGRMIPYRCPYCGDWHMGHRAPASASRASRAA